MKFRPSIISAPTKKERIALRIMIFIGLFTLFLLPVYHFSEREYWLPAIVCVVDDYDVIPLPEILA